MGGTSVINVPRKGGAQKKKGIHVSHPQRRLGACQRSRPAIWWFVFGLRGKKKERTALFRGGRFEPENLSSEETRGGGGGGGGPKAPVTIVFKESPGLKASRGVDDMLGAK